MNDFLLFSLIWWALWYIYYAAESAINGGFARPGNALLIPLKLCWEEITWWLPGGYNKRLKIVGGDSNFLNDLPGPMHCLIVCILAPLLPIFFFCCLKT